MNRIHLSDAYLIPFLCRFFIQAQFRDDPEARFYQDRQ
jgi:hypothetical protein